MNSASDETKEALRQAIKAALAQAIAEAMGTAAGIAREDIYLLFRGTPAENHYCGGTPLPNWVPADGGGVTNRRVDCRRGALR